MKTLVGQELFAFLNGVFQKEYQGNADITPAYLKESLFEETDSEHDVAQFYSYCRDIIKNAASEDYDVFALQNALKKSTLTPQQQEIFVTFWKTQKTKIHKSVIASSTYNNSLKKLAWRIDSKTKSKNVAEISQNQLTAIVEILLDEKKNTKNGSQIVRFELDKDELQKVKKEMENIKQVFSKYEK